ncbi:MAG: flagellar motor switch phosphatase FliY [Lachnospiraceae bacterium]|jgi:flagellar motor switch protein FliN|nr:flagellar motor switch phosphatase FliY [Lachnospiraceae bacterium]MCI9370704.1 flagellar motor switch phosphatase FliY [Lachnospiraceae bacterium]
MDGMLSQEEINALLNGIDSDDSSSEAVSSEDEQVSVELEEVLTSMEIDIMGELSNISMGTAATTLSSLVNQKVDITTPKVGVSTWQDLVDQYDRPCVFIQISYKEGINGNNVFILKDTDVKIIADLMMGGDGTNMEGEIGELHLSAICEAMNQMMGSSSTSLSSMLGMKIDITPPTANLIDLNDDFALEDYSDFLKGNFIKISFKMTVGDLVNSEIMQLYPVELCKTLCNRFGMGEDSSQSETSTTSEPEQSAAATVQDMPAPNMSAMEQQPMAGNMNYGMPMQNASQAMMQGMPQGMPMQQGMPQSMMMQGMPMQQGMPQGMMMTGMPMQNINVQQAQFQTFSPDIVAVNQKENINLIMDVPLQVTVELGRTSKSIQDILEFSPGTIIELNKIAGEPVDVLVNNKYVAKGEVVVIEESFGVRVTEIIR